MIDHKTYGTMQKLRYSKDITVFQLRAARAALKLTLKEVTVLASVSEGALAKLESGDIYLPPQHSSPLTIAKVKSLYESYGVEFYEHNHMCLLPLDENIIFRFKPSKN
jgi:transcriptional regulator with XRE-family HTH domain